MSLAAKAFHLLRPLLHQLDAETAHRATIAALRCAPRLPLQKTADAQLAQNLFGLNFPNPLGLAAGFDKNAEVPDAMLAQGFGFVEVGTVTPKPQSGNPKPRLFRLSEDQAVINRMGFNNEGHAAVLKRLEARRSLPGTVGVNIGANKESADRVADYVQGVACFASCANYITINVSSPNTPGLRGLQSREELEKLLARVHAALAKQKTKVPVLLKIAPDLTIAEMDGIAKCCSSGGVDGVIISNTTTSRPVLNSQHATETGGLSGRPLRKLATQQLARFYLKTNGNIPLIGAGGIEDADSAFEKILAGASLLQIYSALVFKGPGLVHEILCGLRLRLNQKGFATLVQARGSDAERLAYQIGPGK